MSAENPFQIFPDVQALYDQRAEELREITNQRYAAYHEWATANPLAANEYETFMRGEAPCVDWSEIMQKQNVATRAASANVLAYLSEHVGNMIARRKRNNPIRSPLKCSSTNWEKSCLRSIICVFT